MRFGRRSHDIDTDKIDAAVTGEQRRLVDILHALAERIEKAPADRFSVAAEGIADAVEPLARAVDRALGKRS